MDTTRRPAFWAVISADDYSLPIIKAALSSCLPSHSFNEIADVSDLPDSTCPLVQFRPYEDIDFTHVLQHPTTSLSMAYVIRKALIRKHHLWQTVSSWWVKHPYETALRGHVPLSVNFELDYAEFLDEALLECWELNESLAKAEQEWWMLKPGMSEQGQGVRLFCSEANLRHIFEEWEADEHSEEEEDGTDTPVTVNMAERIGAGTMTSQLRHFVAQRYIEKPLLFPQHDRRKFHIRTYTLVVGALKVYVYQDMLALFAPLTFEAPDATKDGDIDPRIHLTNTCLQAGSSTAGSVQRFWDLPQFEGRLSGGWKADAFNQIKNATSALFEAAAREQMIHFQALPNAFEIFGIDWLVDETGSVWLLEVNAYPDFKQSGETLRHLVEKFWEGVICHAVAPFFGIASSNLSNNTDAMVKVLDIDLGRA